MHELVPEVAVAKQRLDGMHVDRLAVAQPEAGRVIHPAVDRDHRQRAGEAGDRDRDAAGEVGAGREAVPAVDVDADEDRLQEEGEALDREAKAEDVAEAGGEVGPEQAQLEAEDRPGHDPGGEQGHHHLRPAPRQRPIELVARAQVEPLDEQHHRREGDPEADERDVHREGQRLHLPGLQQIVLLHLGQWGDRQENELAHPPRLPDVSAVDRIVLVARLKPGERERAEKLLAEGVRGAFMGALS